MDNEILENMCQPSLECESLFPEPPVHARLPRARPGSYRPQHHMIVLDIIEILNVLY